MRARKTDIRWEKFESGQERQGLERVCENWVLEGHGFGRAVNDTAVVGFIAAEVRFSIL